MPTELDKFYADPHLDTSFAFSFPYMALYSRIYIKIISNWSENEVNSLLQFFTSWAPMESKEMFTWPRKCMVLYVPYRLLN